MNINTTLTCFIIGQDNLHLQCAKILKEKHHTILGIISLLEASREWAYEQDIPHYFTLEDARAVLSSTEFDYLFSIVNSHILSEDLLARPRHAAINFHDALLPRYAGVNATNWAILNQEKTHGVTWHIATREVDAGDILKQKAVTIEADETAFNLNLKCYEAALELFPELVDELANQTVQRISQDSDQRTYVGYTHKPEGNGWINWNDSAESIMRTFRALQMGEGYPNPLATAKFTVQDHAFIIQGMSMTENSSHQSPGTVVSCDESGLQIATSTLDIHITAIKNQLGKSVDWKAFQTRYIQAGTVLASPSPEDRATFQTLSQTYMRHESYWVKGWESFDPMQIPFLSQKIQAQDGYHYECVSQLPLSDSLRQALKNLLSAEQDFWTLLLTVWSVYLYRVSNYQNFGFLLSRDSDSTLHPNLACFLNATIPFRVGLEENQTILEAYASVKRALDERQDRAGYLRDIFARYPSLSEVNQPPMLTVLSAAKGEIEASLAGLQADCALVIDPSGDHLSWHVAREYVEADEYLRPILENFSGHLLTMLTGISQNPETSLKDLPILTAAEEHQLLVEWNDTATDYPKDKTIHQLFEEQVEKTPDNVAVCFEDQSLTYRELNEKANQLAWCLLEQGVKVGDVVAVCMERGVEFITTILAILKTGSVYLPIDASCSSSRINHILENSNAMILIEKFNEKKEINKHIKVINFFTEDDNIKSNLNLCVESQKIAYLMYTSGSTGEPKGVEVTHQGVIRLVKNTNHIDFASCKNVAHVSNVAFDAATWEIWGALLNGARVIIFSKTDVFDVELFLNKLKQNSVDAMFLTSALFNHFMDINFSFPSSLKNLFIGGDALSKSKIKKLISLENKPERIVNGYGPTENTTFTTFYEIKKTNFSHSIPIGRPISNTQVYVLDRNYSLLPIGYSGELYTSGDGLACGYKNSPELNKNKFILISIEKMKKKIYKTGDLSRWFSDGNLEFLGRIDNQIKIRGFRVELEEIQESILAHPLVNNCLINYADDKNIGKYLVAYIISKNIKDFNSDVISKFLLNRLPDYMIPSFFILVDKFPLTFNGKIDYKSLPVPKINEISNIDHPENLLQEKLCKIWSEFFKSKKIGINDNFFYLGGHSLLLAKLMRELYKNFDYKLSIENFLKNPTIKNLSQIINEKTAEKSNIEVIKQDIDYFSNIDFSIEKLKNGKIKNAIFLTGSSGFLGVHLLNDLYNNSDSKIYCLVRSESDSLAKEKLIKESLNYGIKITDFDRIVPICGDFSNPFFGLSQDKFFKLAEEIDDIYHNGAQVNHVYSYEVLRKNNVFGTIELLKFATCIKLKKFNFISTLSALDSNFNSTENFLFSNSIPPNVLDGYSQTKWVCERILSMAHTRGIPIKIFRPGWILGQSNTGMVNFENNHLWLLIKGCIQMGVAPSWNTRLSILPVDFVSNSIIKISMDHGATENVFNLINPFFITWIQLIDYINEYGYKIKLESPEDWVKKLIKIEKDNAIFGLLPIYFNSQSSFEWIKNLDSVSDFCHKNFCSELKKLRLSFPKIEKEILFLYFSFLESVKFLDNHYKKNELKIAV